MLNQHDLEQHYQVDTGPVVVLALHILYKFVDPLEIDRFIGLPQQAALGDHTLQTYKFQPSSIFCILSQHFFTPIHYTAFPA